MNTLTHPTQTFEFRFLSVMTERHRPHGLHRTVKSESSPGDFLSGARWKSDAFVIKQLIFLSSLFYLTLDHSSSLLTNEQIGFEFFEFLKGRRREISTGGRVVPDHPPDVQEGCFI